MKFQELSEDNTRSILSFCDISAVLALGSTNTYLRRLTLEKTVWMDLLENMRRRGLIRLSQPDIRTQSQAALSDLVKGLLSGPASWNMPKLPFLARFRSRLSRQPQRHAEIATQFILRPPKLDTSKWIEAKLLGNGEYLLLCNLTLECWNVYDEKLIWTYERNDPDSFIIDFSAEVLDGGNIANIIVCEKGVGFQTFSIRILALNFHTGVFTDLCARLFGETNSYIFADAKICGSLASVILKGDYQTPTENYCILIDWQAKKCLKLVSLTLTTPIRVDPIRNHLLLLTDDRFGIPEISLFNIGAFSRHWRWTNDPSSLDTVHTSEVQSLISESIAFAAHAQSWDTWKREVHAYESPLEEGTYRIWVYLSGFAVPIPKRHVIVCSYILSLPNATRNGLIWRQRTAHNADHVGDCTGIPYSGYRVRYILNHEEQIFHSISHPGEPRQVVLLDLPGHARYNVHISTYNAVLTFVSNNSVVITHFQ
ncbi:hypothetical protein B0H19DRAFT_385369 [Mycena capillaripes]|nr:hypothetical protein B0H19DRAFT_385369 [Mycena capillaripes]